MCTCRHTGFSTHTFIIHGPPNTNPPILRNSIARYIHIHGSFQRQGHLVQTPNTRAIVIRTAQKKNGTPRQCFQTPIQTDPWESEVPTWIPPPSQKKAHKRLSYGLFWDGFPKQPHLHCPSSSALHIRTHQKKALVFGNWHIYTGQGHHPVAMRPSCFLGCRRKGRSLQRRPHGWFRQLAVPLGFGTVLTIWIILLQKPVSSTIW